MQKKISNLVHLTFALILCFSTLSFAQSTSIKWKEDPRIAKIFLDNKIQGTFVILDPKNHTLYGYNKKRAFTRFVPASTFKIFNSLIAFESGVVKNEYQIFPYNGQKRSLSAWEHDMDIQEAIRVSNVPVYQSIARQIGLKRMQSYITKTGYGNQKIGQSVDTFWLRGPLRISAIEQTLFLNNLNQNKVPFSKRSINLLHKIMPNEKEKNSHLYFKTGSAPNGKPGVNWLVGWIENQGKYYPFAMNFETSVLPEPSERISFAKQIFQSLDLL